MKEISIIGLGLMGASLGAALKKRGFEGRITAYARREVTRRQALELGLADAVFTDPVDAVRTADLAVICVPIQTSIHLAEEIVPALKPGAVLTDVGSTKLEMLRRVGPLFERSAAEFIGSHPVAGSEKTGLEAADPDLYQDRLTVVCPAVGNTVEGISRVTALWEAAGSTVTHSDPEAHDRLLACTSHLPHMIAAALARTVAEPDPAAKAPFCGTGFRDTTRVASGSAEMWVDIIDTNRAALEHELSRFGDELQRLAAILRAGNSADIRRWLEEAAAARGMLLTRKAMSARRYDRVAD